ncbi:DUF4291 family protein [Streptomyces sp. NPDC060035]|uniref:DUF4291 family protein n=1 Tax=Streptomyces sp. NPDC060035 TaxID=3347044 RepID=UPI0036BA0906
MQRAPDDCGEQFASVVVRAEQLTNSSKAARSGGGVSVLAHFGAPGGTSNSAILKTLSYRSLQRGLAGAASRRHADEGTVALSDVPPAHEIRGLVRQGDLAGAARLLPEERPYPSGWFLLGQLGHQPF